MIMNNDNRFKATISGRLLEIVAIFPVKNVEFLFNDIDQRLNKPYSYLADSFGKFVECELSKLNCSIEETCIYGDITFTIRLDISGITLAPPTEILNAVSKASEKFWTKHRIQHTKEFKVRNHE